MPVITSDQIRHILQSDSGRLAGVARAASGGGERLELADWTLTRLSGGAGGNPTSDGIFRVAGHVVDPGDQSRQPWSVILKAVRSPVETGEAWDQPGDAVYWRREVEAFHCGMLNEVQGLVVPECWGIEERPNASAWLWLEDLGSLERSAWGVAQFHAAARAIARFHAPYLTGELQIPDHPWLNRDYLRGFHEYLQPWWLRLTARAQAGDPGLAGLRREQASAAVAAVLDVVANPEPLMAIMDELPLTLAHNDTHIDNLTIRPGRHGAAEVVAIDWQMVGPATIGADLGQLLCEVPSGLAPVTRSQFESEALVSYHNELSHAGVVIDLETVERAYCLEALLRQSLWEVLLLCLGLEDLAPEDQQGQAAVVSAFTGNISSGHLPRLAAEAARL